jgi:hypothetical protein
MIEHDPNILLSFHFYEPFLLTHHTEENRALAPTLDARDILTVGSATGEGSVDIARPKDRSDSVSRSFLC